MSDTTKLDAMMKDDDEFKTPQSFAGITPLVPPGDYKDRPNADITTRWKMFEIAYAGWRPYATPYDEYCQNLHPLSRTTLLHRWEGVILEDGRMAERSIQEWYDTPRATKDRIKAQEVRANESGVPDYNDPVQMRQEKNRQVWFIREEMRRIEQVLESGMEVLVEKSFRMKDGGDSRAEMIRPLSSNRRAELNKTFVKLSLLYRELTDENKKVVEHGLTGDLASLMQQAMKERGHVARGGISLEELEQAGRALPAPSDFVEGVVEEPEIVYNLTPRKDPFG